MTESRWSSRSTTSASPKASASSASAKNSPSNTKLYYHTRDPIAAPQSLEDLPGNPTGKAPFLEDPEAHFTLQESGAIRGYILARNAAGQLGSQLPEKRLFKTFGEEAYADYLYWFHWSNSTLQALLDRFTFFEIAQSQQRMLRISGQWQACTTRWRC
ncbi:hypothetical protein T440DRAFT_464029 [Plenodomus tracheiphilus IPT5]|uniref:GST N-terminal domain-containing protein n=1 Tax=Plenodomus tracheiphilus IPT5 TaxID=1408161 RepID=A0A6A7BKD2_9PLEO|nr:hypothetical protein T440DRAFT_464029 [Plenodomus tracheiphilus IPT5]